MGNFAENLNLGNRFRPPPWICDVHVVRPPGVRHGNVSDKEYNRALLLD